MNTMIATDLVIQFCMGPFFCFIEVKVYPARMRLSPLLVVTLQQSCKQASCYRNLITLFEVQYPELQKLDGN